MNDSYSEPPAPQQKNVDKENGSPNDAEQEAAAQMLARKAAYRRLGLVGLAVAVLGLFLVHFGQLSDNPFTALGAIITGLGAVVFLYAMDEYQRED